ncbi:MAG TPA: hypothetical protein VFN35_04815 [Ktedonobacteraceae bacterium]|nr:hypothetical protein [Ktedonobacteraceae bacterium]
MDTTRLTTEMQQFLAYAKLGPLLEIYVPPTGRTILSGLAPFAIPGILGFSLLIEKNANSNTISLGIFFLLFGLIVSLPFFVIALSNSKKLVVICTFGVAFFLDQGFGSFRWQDVLTTTRQGGYKGSWFSYTVYCYNGQRIVFKNLSRMNMLADAIDVSIARARYSSPFIRSSR